MGNERSMKEFIMAAIIIFTSFRLLAFYRAYLAKKKAAFALICNLPYFFFLLSALTIFYLNHSHDVNIKYIYYL